VTILDAANGTVFNGTTDGTGSITTVLTEFRMFNTLAGNSQELHTPHVVSVSKIGCTLQTFPVSVNQPLNRTIQLSCP
jgi:hypothetical protein